MVDLIALGVVGYTSYNIGRKIGQYEAKAAIKRKKKNRRNEARTINVRGGSMVKEISE